MPAYVSHGLKNPENPEENPVERRHFNGHFYFVKKKLKRRDSPGASPVLDTSASVRAQAIPYKNVIAIEFDK
jgi:hypothetical protein